MATYAKVHPLRSMIGITVVLAILALGVYAATAYARDGGGAKPDDRGGATNVSDDPAGHDHGGVVSAATPAAQADNAKKQVFRVNLDALNRSGVSGIVLLKLEGDELQVRIRARGLEPGQVHMQHIHGIANGSGAVCPPPAADLNGDGLISLAEGLPYFGPVLRALFLQGLTTYPTADGHGRVRYDATFSGAELDALRLMDFPLENRVVVLHGMTINGAYSPSLPVACGEIVASGADNAGDDRGADRSSR